MVGLVVKPYNSTDLNIHNGTSTSLVQKNSSLVGYTVPMTSSVMSYLETEEGQEVVSQLAEYITTLRVIDDSITAISTSASSAAIAAYSSADIDKIKILADAGVQEAKSAYTILKKLSIEFIKANTGAYSDAMCVNSATASGASAFGIGSLAKAPGSIAAGFRAIAGSDNGYEGIGSLSLGNNTKTSTNFKTAIGEYNSDLSSALFEVGNGTSDDARSNAFCVMRDGTARVAYQGTQPTSVVRRSYIGDLSELITDDKTSVIAAINELAELLFGVQELLDSVT